MPTKRELRELEDTVQLSAAEIERAEKEAEAEEEAEKQMDSDDISIPVFANRESKNYEELAAQDVPEIQPKVERKPKPVYVQPADTTEEKKADYKPMIVGLIIFALFLAVSFGIINGKKNSKNPSAQAQTETPSATEEPTAKATHEPELEYFYLQQATSAIVNRLTEEYGSDYTKPTSEQFKISGSEDTPSIDFDLTVGNAFKKNYIIPVHVDLEWDAEGQTYSITNFTADDSNAETSEFKSHSSKKQAKKQAEKSTVEGKQVSNFTVNITNSVTVNITSKGEGEVSAYAIAEDGTRTLLASVSNGTASETVKLESGAYELVLYAVDGVGYSWNYNLG